MIISQVLSAVLEISLEDEKYLSTIDTLYK